MKIKVIIVQKNNINKCVDTKNCLESDTDRRCSKAIDGYYLDENKKPVKCQNSCKTCTSKESCISCNQHYYITSSSDYKKCVDTEHCLYEGNTEGKCEEAEDGYYLDQN